MSEVICLCTWHGIGGAQLNAALVATELRKREIGSELAFLFARDENPQFDDIDETLISKSVPAGFLGWVKFIYRLFSYLRREKPKYIIGFHPLANIVGSIFCALSFRSKFIATQRNPHSSQGRYTSKIEKILGMYLYSSNICVSNAIYQDYSSYPSRYVRKMVVVHNGTPELPVPSEPRELIRSRYGMEGFTLGSLGRLHEQKNIEFTIQLMRHLPDFKYYIAGDGEQNSYLKSLVVELNLSDRVIFVGELRGQDISDFYTGIDILLFPSIYEGFGRVLVEALSFELPVVCNDIPVLREVGGGAVMFAPLDADKWLSAIKVYSSSEALRNEQKHKARAAASKFSISSMIAGYIKEMDGVDVEE